jgi:PAS domain S-box-containing protein
MAVRKKEKRTRPGTAPLEDRVTAILDSIADGVFTVDKDWLITSFNKAAERITGVPENEAICSYCCDVFRASICETDCALRKTLETGKPIVNKAVFIVNSSGEKIPISISTALLKDKRGKVIGGVETFRDLSMVEQLRKELHSTYTLEDIVSKSRRMQQLFETLPLIARSDSTILIEGESGTGKELIARAVHNLSNRRKGPLITVNCGALPDALLESELFGYKAGAFTDAKKDKPGRFALADKGTIFLDEIGDISPALQAKLLRVLQEKVYEPLGSVKSETSNARVIAATNKNLLRLTEEGKFRQDLYYRINVVKIDVPPLRDRKEDIPLLVENFVGKFNRLKGKDIAGFSPEALKILLNHDYPGNVRELENIVEHAFVLLPGGMITPSFLPAYILKTDRKETGLPQSTLSGVEREFILKALERNNWNRLKTARELAMHKTTLYRRIKKLQIELPVKDGRSEQSK